MPRRPLLHNRLQSASPAWCIGRASHPCARSDTTLPYGHSQAPPHARWRRSQCPRHGCAPSMAATTARPSAAAAANPTTQDRPPATATSSGSSCSVSAHYASPRGWSVGAGLSLPTPTPLTLVLPPAAVHVPFYPVCLPSRRTTSLGHDGQLL